MLIQSKYPFDGHFAWIKDFGIWPIKQTALKQSKTLPRRETLGHCGGRGCNIFVSCFVNLVYRLPSLIKVCLCLQGPILWTMECPQCPMKLEGAESIEHLSGGSLLKWWIGVWNASRLRNTIFIMCLYMKRLQDHMWWRHHNSYHFKLINLMHKTMNVFDICYLKDITALLLNFLVVNTICT